MIAFLTDGWSAQAISAINAVLALTAFATHVYAASKTSGHLRHMFMAIAGLAMFYSAAYWWLFYNPERVNEWSDFLRPFGVISWVAAWTIEPVVFVRYLTRSGHIIKARAEEQAAVGRERIDRSEREFPL